MANITRAARQSFSSAARLLDQDDLHLPQRKYYNLIKADASLSKEQQVKALTRFLLTADFRVAVNKKYHLNIFTGEKESRIVEQIFFCSPQQITLARRFIND